MKKVIVIGGGFAGSKIVKALEKYFDVILVDKTDYFEFTPGILRTIVQPEHVKEIQVLHTHYLRRAKVVTGIVNDIQDKFIKVGNKKFRFDYLVICSGSTYNSPFKEQDVVLPLRANNLRDCYDKLCKAKKVLIIGGGLVGVELAGEILDRYSDKKTIIVHAKERLIERNKEKASSYAEKYFKKRGVKIIYNEKVIKERSGFFITDKGRKLKADMAFLCTGIKPNFDLLKKSMLKVLNEKNQAKVNEFLQVEGKKNIFAAGDITSVQEEKTAQNSERQADIVINNIFALEKKKKLKKYVSKRTPMVISLGKYNGIFDTKNNTFTGIIPAFMKWTIEKWSMWKKRRV